MKVIKSHGARSRRRCLLAAAALPLAAVTMLIASLAFFPTDACRADQWVYVEFEGESYFAENNTGGVDIMLKPCGGASGGLIVEGIDQVGEWIELLVDLPENTYYEPSIRFQGYAGYTTDVRMTLLGAGPGGEDLSSDFSFVGTGIL